MRAGFQRSDWKGPRAQGMSTEGEGSRSLVRIHEAGKVRTGSDDGKGERQDIIEQIEGNGTG